MSVVQTRPRTNADLIVVPYRRISTAALLTNVVLILLTGRTVLGALRRTARRAAFTASTTFEPAGPALP